MNRISAVILSIVIFFSSAVSLYADTQPVASTPAEKYDVSLGRYTETFAGGRQFLSTVPNNGKTYDAVLLDMPSETDIVLKCDGRTVFFDDAQPICEPGYYTVEINAADVLSGENTKTLFVFRIMGKPQTSVYNSTYKCGEIQCAPVIEGDAQNGMYLYRFPNYKCFFTSLNEGEKEAYEAMFRFPSNIGFKLYKNGKESYFEQNGRLTAPGNYRVEVYAKNYGVSDGYEAVYKAVLEFVIPAPVSDVPSAAADFADYPSVSGGGSYAAFAAAGTYSAPDINTQNADIQADISTPAVTEDEITDTENDTERVELYESYNEDAKMYKEAFPSGDSFYTNTQNGDISGGNVYIDIPANINAALKKDGGVIPFENKTYINAPGTYMLDLTDNYGTRRMSAVYSFRIQGGVDKSETEIEESPEQEISFSGISDYSFDAEMNRFAYEIGGKAVYTNVPSGMFSNEGLELSLPDGVTATAEKDGEEYPIEENEINENGTYTVTLKDEGDSVLSLSFYLYNREVNSFEDYYAPDGYTITGISYEDYKGTYAAEAESDENEDENGVYPSEAEDEADGEETTDAADSEGTEDTEDNGAIDAEQWKRDMETISELSEEAENYGVSYMVMPLDGRYTVTMESGEGMPTLTTEILVDRTLPDVAFEGLDENNVSTGNSFTLACDENDVTLVLYRSNGEEEVLSEQGGTFTVKGVDRYTVTAIDRAGNESSYQVRIKRHIGAAGVATLVLLAVLLASLAGFILYNSKKFSVR